MIVDKPQTKSTSLDLNAYFQLPDNIYFATHAVGPKMTACDPACERYHKAWQLRGVDAWENWLEEIENFKQALTQLLEGESEEYCTQVNISSAICKVIASLPQRKRRNKIVLSELSFPSTGFAISASAQSKYRLNFIGEELYKNPLETWSKALTKDVQAVFLTHAFSNNGYLTNIKPIIQLAKQRNIFTIIDIAHSAGIRPIDVTYWDADFVIGSALKWLCGGPGAGFMWVNNDSIEQFKPTDSGWFSHEDPFELNIFNFRFAPDARRFWGGTPNVLPYVIANASIRSLAKLGFNDIFRHNQQLIEQLISGLTNPNVDLVSPLEPSLRSGTVVIKLNHSEKVHAALRNEKIIVDFHKDFGFRISPHIFNTKQQIDVILNVINSIRYK